MRLFYYFKNGIGVVVGLAIVFPAFLGEDGAKNPRRSALSFFTKTRRTNLEREGSSEAFCSGLRFVEATLSSVSQMKS